MAITLRPILTIAGLIGSMLVLHVMDGILTAGFVTAFDGANTNSTTGVFAFITVLVMYAVVSIIIVYGSFRLVQTIPDAVLKWIGESDDDAMGVEQHQNQGTSMIYMANSTVKSAQSAGNMAKNEAKKAGKKANEVKAPKGQQEDHGTGDSR